MNIVLNLKKIFNYVRLNLSRRFLYKYGIGSRVEKDIWEHQFEKGAWDYLYSEEESGHYLSIRKLYAKYGKGTILDVGCGQGVLFHYLKEEIENPSDYLGIDISATAIQQAQNDFPGFRFEQVDFDKKIVREKFDVIIFNECLYYFNKPYDRLASSIRESLKPGGSVIVSIFDYAEHALIWKRLSEEYDFIETDSVQNAKGQKWKIGLFKPTV